MGEDQDAAGPRGLDEADRGDRLAGAGRVLEPEAALGAGVLGRLLDRAPRRPRARPPSPAAPRRAPAARRRPRLRRPSPLAAAGLRGRRRPRRGAVAAPLAAPLRRPLAAVCCSAISSASVPESASTWCAVELGAVAQLRRLVGEQPLEPEQQREVLAPLDRGRLGARVDLGQRGVERAAAGRARAQGPPAPRRRAGSGSRANSPRARSRRLRELPPSRQLRWSWP